MLMYKDYRCTVHCTLKIKNAHYRTRKAIKIVELTETFLRRSPTMLSAEIFAEVLY